MNVQTLKDNLELVIAVVGAASAVGGAGLAVLIYLWKVSRWVGQVVDRDKAIGKRLVSLTDQIQKFRIDMAGMVVKLEEREKDQARLEGKIEQNTAAMTRLVGDLRALSDSNGRIWATLRAIRPDVVPKRAGDPG